MDALPVAVTVFPDRARVTRRGQAVLEPGVQKIEIGGLPLALMPDSVRASGQGTARVKLLGVSTLLENFLETPAEAARQLEAEIQTVEDADAALASQAAVLEKMQSFLEGLGAQGEMFARGLALGYRTPDQQGTVFDFTRQRLDAVQTERLKIGRERREGGKVLNRLRRDLQNVQAARPRQRYVAVVDLEVTAAGKFDLDLTYVVTGASWKPLYDLRLAASGLTVTYLAQVAQQTGEDWMNVALTLSTAQPALALIIPELEPWYVFPRPTEMPKARFRSAAPGLAAAAPPPAPMMAQAAAFGAEPEEPEPLAMDVATATVSDAGASLTYRLPALADIPGSQEPRKVTVAVFSLRPELDAVTAPKSEAVCYRRAKVQNDSPYTLLPGSAQLFDGDEYLGATALKLVAPGQGFELALGADERLRVERKLAARDVDKTFMGDRRRMHYAYTLEIENLREVSQTVEVRDQLPVPRDEQIRVKLELADPKPAQVTELNSLTWKLTLDKGAKQKIRFDFSVEYPRALVVDGLP